MIQLNKISLSFGSQAIFDNISAMFNQQDRIGLVGANGAGKSTLLKVISGLLSLDEGSVSIAKNKTVAYMPQEVVLESHKTILQETFTAFDRVASMQQEYDELQKLLEDPHVDAAVIDRVVEIATLLAELDPENALVETKKILLGLGFKQEQFEDSVDTLSIGWRMRIVLAKLLLQKADFYLFDEPTNHLDIFAKEWFLEFLGNSSSGFLIISHERYFLDQVCSKIFELERGKGTLYSGNYSSYCQQKQEQVAMLEQAYHTQQKDIKRKKETINRFRASASKATMARSMERQLDKLERVEIPPQLRRINLTIGSVAQSGKVVLTLKNVRQQFNNKIIFEHVSGEIVRQEKVALVAANGVGKSTLFNIIAGKLPLQQGSIELGYNVKMALFEQHQDLVLDPNKTVIQEVLDSTPNKTQEAIRSLLGAFLFSNAQIDKKIKVLSGGEKQRVSMVKVLLQDANFLVLDEPTNHLDIQSKEILLSALQAYQGTLLFVSHDRDFISALATRIVELTPNGLESYQGTFEEYLYCKQHREQIVTTSPKQVAVPQVANNSEPKVNRAEVKKLENKIERIEQLRSSTLEKLGTAEYNSKDYLRWHKDFLRLDKDLAAAQAEWETMVKE